MKERCTKEEEKRGEREGRCSWGGAKRLRYEREEKQSKVNKRKG